MTKDHARERIKIIEQKIEKLQRAHDPTSTAELCELEALGAERCYLRSIIAYEERDAIAWRRLEAQARQGQLKAQKEHWSEQLRQLNQKLEQDESIGGEFDAMLRMEH
jgi:hypothetical protein